MLKLRNPYGEVEWEGDWSDESDKWTPELREELNVVIANDGIFYIAFHDYLKHFRCTSINYETRKSRQSAVKVSRIEYDFNQFITSEDHPEPYNFASFGL